MGPENFNGCSPNHPKLDYFQGWVLRGSYPKPQKFQGWTQKVCSPNHPNHPKFDSCSIDAPGFGHLPLKEHQFWKYVLKLWGCNQLVLPPAWTNHGSNHLRQPRLMEVLKATTTCPLWMARLSLMVVSSKKSSRRSRKKNDVMMMLVSLGKRVESGPMSRQKSNHNNPSLI